METYAIIIGFFLNNLMWMIYSQSQKYGKDFVQEIKTIIPDIIPKIKRAPKYSDVNTATPQDAMKILKNLSNQK